MFKRVVVGYAGERAGRDSVKLAAELAAVLGSEVTVVYPYNPLLASLSADAVEERIRAEMQALMPDSEELAGGTCRWSNSSWPIHALHSMADFEDAELIVIGAAREGMASHLHVSLIERMVHGAPCAVAIAPTGYAEHGRGTPRKIGVGFFDSDEGIAALGLGHEIAERVGGELELIAASGWSAGGTGYAFSSALLPEVEDQIYAETETRLEQLAAGLGGRVPIRMDVERGDPCGVLTARSKHLDLLVLGSRAYGPLRHALLGSVSASVTQKAHCPVLIVPRGASEHLRHALAGRTRTSSSMQVGTPDPERIPT